MNKNMQMNYTAGQSVQERVNPVFSTAKKTARLMARAGVPGADRIVRRMEAEGGRLLPVMTDPDILLCCTVAAEAGYRTMCRLTEESGYRCNVDLPCGFTPKAIHLTEKGLSYVGLDLPVVAQEAGQVFFSLAVHPERMRFRGVDATNFKSLEDALQDTEGPLCITTEGLMMYFTDHEACTVASNIRKLLEKHGGCWITPDPEFFLQFMLTFRSLFGEKAARKLAARGLAAIEHPDEEDVDNSIMLRYSDVAGTARAAEAFLEKHGLKVEKICMAEHMPELSIYRDLTEEQIARFKDAMKKIHYWLITADGSREVREEQPEQPFGMIYSLEDGILQMALRGRVDTITAPELLAVWETQNTVHDVGEVRIDCTDLVYMSSVGLRVLLHMQKNCSRGIVLYGVSPLVREILEQTGFDDMFIIR